MASELANSKHETSLTPRVLTCQLMTHGGHVCGAANQGGVHTP